MWGIFGKPLKRAIWNTLGLHAVPTTCFRFSSVLDGACVACCLFLKKAATTSTYRLTPRAVASPDAPQKPLVRKRARSGGAQWVRVQRHEPGSRAKKSRTSQEETVGDNLLFGDAGSHALYGSLVQVTMLLSRLSV